MSKSKTSNTSWASTAGMGVVALSIVCAVCWALRSRQPAVGGIGVIQSTPGLVAPTTKDFFQDTQEGRELDASLKLALKGLQDSGSVTADSVLKEKVVVLADVFDAYNRDLRTFLQSAYMKYLTGMSQASTNPALQQSLSEGHDRIVDLAQRRIAQLRALEVQAKAYAAHPSQAGLADLGTSLRAMFADHRDAPPADGLSRLVRAALDVPPTDVWQYEDKDRATMRVPLTLSGEIRITGNIDKTPFMGRQRDVTLTLENVDPAGIQAFAAHVKTDVPLGPDGSAHLDPTAKVYCGRTAAVRRLGAHDGSPYLAWRGETMTKEEFARRYPKAVIVLTVSP